MSGMRRFGGAATRLAGVAITLFVPAAFLVSTAGAASQLPSGDTCTASGDGNSYTLTITLPPNASPQGGFAFGAKGVKVTNINVAGEVGSLSTQSLPPNTTGEWLTASPPRPGESVTAVLTTSGRVTGSFRVIAASSPPSGSFFKEVLCAVQHGSPVSSNLFTVNPNVSYDAAARAWHLHVTVPGAGTVTGIRRLRRPRRVRAPSRRPRRRRSRPGRSSRRARARSRCRSDRTPAGMPHSRARRDHADDDRRVQPEGREVCRQGPPPDAAEVSR